MRVQYDFDNERVVGIENNGQVSATNNPYIPGTRTEWLDAIRVLPEGYDPRYESLLRVETVRYTYDAGTNTIMVEYPNADFSPAALRTELKWLAKRQARMALSDTDWAVIRSVETGAPIPAEVKTKRAELRAKADEYERQIDNVAEGDLADFVVAFGNRPSPHPAPPTPPRRQTNHVEDPRFSVDDPVQRPTKDKQVEGGDETQWITDATSPTQKGRPQKRATSRDQNPNGPRTDT